MPDLLFRRSAEPTDANGSEAPRRAPTAGRRRPAARGGNRLKVVGLLTVLALALGQPVAKAVFPTEPDGPGGTTTETPAAGGAAVDTDIEDLRAKRTVTQPPADAAAAPDPAPVADQGAAGLASGAADDITAAVAATDADTGEGTADTGGAPTADAGTTQVETTPVAAAGAGLGSQSDQAGQFFELSFNPDAGKQAQPERVQQAAGQGDCPADDDHCQLCQAYPTELSCDGAQPTVVGSGSGCVDANDDQVCDEPSPTPAAEAPPAEAPAVQAQPAVPACVAAGGRDGDGDGNCDDTDDDNGDGVLDIDQDIDQNGCLDQVQVQMGCASAAPDINNDGADDTAEDWDHDGTPNGLDNDIDGDGIENQVDHDCPINGCHLPTPEPATATQTATASPTATATASPTATATATPAASPTQTAAASPAAASTTSGTGLGAVGDAIAWAYQTASDCISYACGKAMLALPIALWDLGRKAFEVSAEVGAERARRDADLAAAGIDPATVPQPEDQVIDPMLGTTAGDLGYVTRVAQSDEAKGVAVQGALEGAGWGLGAMLRPVVEGWIPGLVNRARQAVGLGAAEGMEQGIEEGAEQAVRQGDELPGAGREPQVLPSPVLPEGDQAQPALPKGFKNPEEFAQFGGDLRQALNNAGYDDAVPILQGSAVTGVSHDTGEAFDVGRTSDFDVALVSPKMFEWAKAHNISIRAGGLRTRELNSRELRDLGIRDAVRALEAKVGRRINFMIFANAEEAAKFSQSITVP